LEQPDGSVDRPESKRSGLLRPLGAPSRRSWNVIAGSGFEPFLRCDALQNFGAEAKAPACLRERHTLPSGLRTVSEVFGRSIGSDCAPNTV